MKFPAVAFSNINKQKKTRRGRPDYIQEKSNLADKNSTEDFPVLIGPNDPYQPTRYRPSFGKTFWGKQWLNALSNIDNENRLPRGRSYAWRGAVQKIRIGANVITALVKGSRPKPYQVNITVPEFNNHQKEKLTALFQAKPAWIAGLYNKELSAELINEAQRIGVSLFPSSWKDFEMNCSCPDWALPCKHIAAVIYILSGDIDLNPVEILNLRNYNIRKTFIDHRPISRREEHDFDEIIFNEIKPKKPSKSINDFTQLDYSKIQPVADEVLKLLPASTPFSSDKFKALVLELFNRSRLEADRLLSKSFSGNDSIENIEPCFIRLDNTISNAAIVYQDIKQDHFETPGQWIERSLGISHEMISRLPHSLRLLREYSVFALHLIAKGSVIPAIYRIDGHFRILWQPLNAQAHIANNIALLDKLNHHGIIRKSQEDKKENSFLINQNENPFHILSLFISSFIKKTAVESNKININDLAQQFIFLEKPLPVNTYKLIAENIRVWLRLLTAGKKMFVPVFKIIYEDDRFKIELLINDKQNNRTITMSDFSSDEKYESERFEIIRSLLLMKPVFPQIENIINTRGRSNSEFNGEEFSKIYFSLLPVIEMIGFEVLMPKELKKITSPVRKLAVNSNTNKKHSLLNLSSLLDFQWTIAIGDKKYTEKEFRDLVKNVNGIVKIQNDYVYVSGEEVKKVLHSLNEPFSSTPLKILASILANEFEGTELIVNEKLKKEIKRLMKIENVKVPSSIEAKLRPYQTAGFEWLYKNCSINFGSILADDMGLGKTLQAICLLQKFKDEGKFSGKQALLIVPTSLMTNWGAELKRFAPELTWAIHHGQKRSIANYKDADIVLTSYGTIRKDYELIKEKKWKTIIIDEAQNIKNPNTDQTKAVKGLKADIRIALSGTPVENRLIEYWSIMDFTNKGLLGGLQSFQNYFAKPIEIESDQTRAESFRKLTSPFILRRLKTDKSIISDLPDKTISNRYCSLSKEQAAIYENIVNETMLAIESSDGIQRRGLVFKMMTALKQVCNHPANYLKKFKTDAKHSGKLQLLLELLRETLLANEKVILFTQYKEMGELLAKFIQEEFSLDSLFLHGSLTRNNRDTLVERFQSSDRDKIFILSLKAGGTGLNLTAASNVIHYDLWWNPAVEEQATDRAYRIGQHKNVLVQRLITKGTLEEKIDALIQSKRKLAAMTVASGEKWIGELSDNELMELVKLR